MASELLDYYFMNNRHKTDVDCEKAIKRNIYNLVYIPHEMMTECMCEYCVRVDWTIIDDIPDKFRTKKMNVFIIKKLLMIAED